MGTPQKRHRREFPPFFSTLLSYFTTRGEGVNDRIGSRLERASSSSLKLRVLYTQESAPEGIFALQEVESPLELQQARGGASPGGVESSLRVHSRCARPGESSVFFVSPCGVFFASEPQLQQAQAPHRTDPPASPCGCALRGCALHRYTAPHALHRPLAATGPPALGRPPWPWRVCR